MGFSAGNDELLTWLVPVLCLGALAWSIAVVTMALKGNDMERSDRVAQLYGYTVCLVAVVVVLISISSLIDNLFKMSNPLALNGYPYGNTSLTSFEAYKATVDSNEFNVDAVNATPGAVISKGAKPHVSEPELRARYEALRSDRLANARFEAERSLTGAFVLLLIALALFGFHWRWLRSRTPAPQGT